MIMKKILIISLLFILFAGNASAWLSGYDYRMNITINNTDGSSLSYQPYNFSINTATLVSAGKMFANGSDVEITTDADVILNWWNETDFNGTSTKIWVNGTSLSNTANTTHHIYYNKSSDVVFDGDISATFDYGEDFEYGSVGYDLITNTNWVNVVTPNVFETAIISKQGKYSGNQSSSSGNGRMKLDISNYPLASEKFCYEYAWYVSSTSSYQMIDMAEAGNAGVTLGMGIISAGTLSHVVGGAWYDITTCPATTWHKMKVVIDPTANTYDLFMNGTQVLTGSGLRAFNPPADMYVTVGAIFGYTDNIFLREYHDNDIKVYLGSEETESGTFTPISISSPSPGVSDIKYVSNKTVTYSATSSKTADNKWSYGNGTFIEWDNSTTTPSMEVWINSSETKYFNISLTAYATGNKSDNVAESWNNSITDNLFDSTNYTWSRWDELDLEGWVGSLGNIEVGDVDNDGADEIVVVGSIQGGSYNNRDMIFYELDGTRTRYTDVTSPNYVFTEASIHDVTEDGINEMLCIYAYESPDGISDIYRFNTSGLNGSNLNNDIMTSGSNNPKAISWIDINNDEHYYSCGCGAGETVNCYTNLSSHSASGIDDFAISAEDNIAWDIDGDGQMELLVVEAWAANAAKIWMYEISNTTGAYTSKTMLFDNSSAGGTHYSAAIHTGDIDNDGIDNLIIHWEGGSSFWSESYRIEAYEFDGITNFGEGNFSEGFVVDATSKYCARGHGKTFVADVDNDGLNELVTGGHTATTIYPYPVTIDYYDITGGGASITKNEIMNCSVAYMGGVSYNSPSITPAFISHGKIVVSVGKDRTTGASLENEIYILESVNNLPAPISISLHSKSPETLFTNYTGLLSASYIVESSVELNMSSMAFLIGMNYTLTSDYHSYLKVPGNSIADDGIYRAHNRNTTPYLSWEGNSTITEGNVWKWSGGEYGDFWITNTSINNTHTWVNMTGVASNVFSSMFYLGRSAMYESEKTGIEINRAQGVIFKIWDLEQFRGRSYDYYLSLYFDSQIESTPNENIEIWYCNDSFDPLTDDPCDVCDYKDTWTSDRWMDHEAWQPHTNVSYAKPLQVHAGTATCPSSPTEVNYIYLKSDTVSSKSYILNATNSDPGICNLTYAQTETMWLRNEITGTNTPHAYTPSFFNTFVRDYQEFTHHMYLANDQGVWGHSDYTIHPIGISNLNPTFCKYNYFWWNGTTDYNMNGSYTEDFYINLTYGFDPDNGAALTHVLSLYDEDYNFVTFVNSSLVGNQTDDDVYFNLESYTSLYSSDKYRFKIVSTDNEGSTSVSWSNLFSIPLESKYKNVATVIKAFPATLQHTLTTLLSYIPLLIAGLIAGFLIILVMSIFGKLKRW